MLGIYSLPRVALAPLFILWFGIDSLSKIMMAFSMVVFVVILNTYEGVRGVDRDLIDMLRTMRAPRSYVLRRVVRAMRDASLEIDQVGRLGGAEFAVILPDPTTVPTLVREIEIGRAHV
mgnify:CR=1 FL=1